jgi:hypothetical protein
MVKKIDGLAEKTRHLLDPIRLVRMVQEITGYGESEESHTPSRQAGWGL